MSSSPAHGRALTPRRSDRFARRPSKPVPHPISLRTPLAETTRFTSRCKATTTSTLGRGPSRRPVAWSGVARLALGVAVAAGRNCGVRRARAQCSIPTAAATSVQVTPATQDAIHNCAEAARAAFSGGDFAQIKRVRDALLAPLRQARVTAQFDSVWTSAAPVLREAVRTQRETRC